MADSEQRTEGTVTPAPTAALESAAEDLVDLRRKGAQDGGAASQVPLRRECSLTMVAPKYDDTDDPLSRLVNERSRKSRFPRRVPVVDPTLAQATVDVGPFDRTARPPSPAHPGVRVVWTGDMLPEILDYLAFCRQLVGKGDIPVSEPLEDDEQALEFLQEHGGNDVTRARLMLISAMGGGSELASVSIEQERESKTRPRTKGAFKSWVGGEFPRESEIHPDAGNPAKVKALWKDWTARCKKALANPQVTPNELFALQREERTIPRFQSKNSQDDDSIVNAANDASFDLEARLRDIQIFIAEVHDALSLVQSERRLTAAALKKLADGAPRKIVMKEVEVLKLLVAQSENWEKRAARWLSSIDEDESGAGSSGKDGASPVNGVPNEKPGRRGGAGKVQVQAQEFSLAELSELIREGRESQVDHSALLTALENRRDDCERILTRAALHIPQDKTWRQNRKKYEILTLANVKAFREELRRTKLKVRQLEWLDKHVLAAEEWIRNMQRATTITKDRSGARERTHIRELISLLHKADQIPVDLSEEKKTLELYVNKAQDWVRRAKAFFPPTRGSAVASGNASKKTRATQAAVEESGFKKGSAEDFLKLTAEAEREGFDNLAEANAAMEAAETIETWIERVREALRAEKSKETLAALKTLLEEAALLDAVVPEEKALRQAAMMMEWSDTAMSYVESAPGTVKLSTMETHLAEADRLFPDEPVNPKRKKKRSIVLDNEPELRAIVEETQLWVDSANTLLQPSSSTQKFENIDQLKQLLETQTRANVSDIRAKVVARIKKVGAWQREVRDTLVATGQYSKELVDAQPTVDSILVHLKTQDESEEDNEAEMDIEEKEKAPENNGEDHPDKANEDDDDGPLKISLESLKNMLHESQRLGVRTIEYDFLSELDGKVRDWLSRYQVLPLEQPAEQTATQAPSDGQLNSSVPPIPPPVRSRPKKGKRGGSSDDFLPSAARQALTEEDLVRLREEAEALPVDLSDKLEDLERCIEGTIEWKQMCSDALQRYREACSNPGPGGFEDLPESDVYPLIAALEQRSSRRSMLQALSLVSFDEKGHEKFPVEKEEQCSWWRRDLPDAIRFAIQEMADAMKEAQQRKLHLIALDSEPVRVCANLIRGFVWLMTVRQEYLESSNPSGKPLGGICQAALIGTRLLAPADILIDLPEAFPESELEEYAIPHLSLINDKAGGSENHANGTAEDENNEVRLVHPPASKRHRGMAMTEGLAPGEKETNSSPSALFGYSSALADNWRILKYIKDVVPSEAEGSEPRLNMNGVYGSVLRRLFGLRRISQTALASRGQAKRLGQIPRAERTVARLKQLIAQSACWTSAFRLEEDIRFTTLLTTAESWMGERRKLFAAKGSTIDQLEKFAERGDRLFVDPAAVEAVRNQTRQAQEWLKAFQDCGLDKGTADIETLRELMQRGDKILGVNLKTALDALRKATEVFCMCRSARDLDMMRCYRCSEEFHRSCLQGCEFGNICPVCCAIDGADQSAGGGATSFARLLAYVYSPSEQRPKISDEQDRDLRAILEDVQHLAKEVEGYQQHNNNADSVKTPSSSSGAVAAPYFNARQRLPVIPESVRDFADLRVVLEGLAAQAWRTRVETLRNRPSLEQLDAVLSDTPPGIHPKNVHGLRAIRTRGEHVAQQYNAIWNCGIDTPRDWILARCMELKTEIESVPLDFASIFKALNACIDDDAERYCSCRKFNDGQLMVECERCKTWWHGKCEGLVAEPIGEWICKECKQNSDVPMAINQ